MTTLPRLLVLTDRRQARQALVQTIERAVAGGARAIVLREKDLEKTERDGLADLLWQVLAPVGGTLIAASRPAGPATGLHLAAGDPLVPAGDLPVRVGDPPVRVGVLGRSCHDAAEVRAAGAVDYLTVSPVFPTASKPGYGPPLGLAGLRELCQATDVPVYALGGVTPANAAACLDAGAHGVAVMGEVMRADEPAATVAGLLKRITKEAPA